MRGGAQVRAGSDRAPILERMKRALGFLVLLAGGIITASVGAVAYRSMPPWGLVGCILMVLCAVAFARTWLGWAGLATFSITWMVATFIWALDGPGGSVLIVADSLGVTWLVGAALALVAMSVVPRRWLVGDHGAQ